MEIVTASRRVGDKPLAMRGIVEARGHGVSPELKSGGTPPEAPLSTPSDGSPNGTL